MCAWTSDLPFVLVFPSFADASSQLLDLYDEQASQGKTPGAADSASLESAAPGVPPNAAPSQNGIHSSAPDRPPSHQSASVAMTGGSAAASHHPPPNQDHPAQCKVGCCRAPTQCNLAEYSRQPSWFCTRVGSLNARMRVARTDGKCQEEDLNQTGNTCGIALKNRPCFSLSLLHVCWSTLPRRLTDCRPADFRSSYISLLFCLYRLLMVVFFFFGGADGLLPLWFQPNHVAHSASAPAHTSQPPRIPPGPGNQMVMLSQRHLCVLGFAWLAQERARTVHSVVRGVARAIEDVSHDILCGCQRSIVTPCCAWLYMVVIGVYRKSCLAPLRALCCSRVQKDSQHL